METALLLTVTLVPTAFWLWLFLRRDVNPEPPVLLLRTFAYGMLAWVLSVLLELSMNGVHVAVVVIVVSAVVEEAAKFLAASTAVRERSFDEPMDGLIYAVTAALGFALMENLTYGLRFGTEVAVWRGAVTMLAHALFSAPLGYGLARAHFGGGRGWRRRGLLMAIVLHVAFNGLMAGTPGWWQLGTLAVSLGLTYVFVDRLYARVTPRRQ